MTSAAFDTRHVDAYLDYLATLEGDQACIAQQDIYNEFGLLLLPKGSPISPKTALRLSGHLLQDPVDQVVGLSKPLTTRSLLEQMLGLLRAEDDLRLLDEVSEASSLLRHLMLQHELPHTILQKLTVMQSRFPRLFLRSMGGTMLSVVVARYLGWDNEHMLDVLHAALARDIGLLHTPVEPPEIDMPLQYSAKTMHHGSISARILALEGRYSQRVIMAVADHHERPDGTGFPKAKHGKQVSASAWLINAMDMVWALRDAAGEEAGGLGALRAFLLINASDSEHDPLHVLSNLVQRAHLQPVEDTVDAGELQSLTTCAISRNQLIGRMAELLRQLATCLAPRMSSRATTTLAVVETLLTALRSSGLGSLEAAAGLSAAEVSQAYTPQELLDLDLTQTEFLWRIRRLVRLAPALRQELPNSPALPALDAHFKELEQLLAEVGTDSCVHLARRQ